MPVLVTGGAGFLGSHLCDDLLAEGNKVVAVDNLLTGNIDNVRHLSRDSRFEFCDLDICEPFDCGPVEHVFHFASPAAPADYMVHGITTLRTGSLGTLRALDLARKYGARFLLASASEVYGDPNQHPQHEDYWGNANPVSERSVYTQAKRLSDRKSTRLNSSHRCISYAVFCLKKKKLNATISAIFDVN